MRYIFEKVLSPIGPDNRLELDDREFSTDQDAVVHAIKIDANYIWEASDDKNPREVPFR